MRNRNRLPQFVIDVIDPAGRYMRTSSPRHPRMNRRDVPRQFAAYAPVGEKPRPVPDPAQRQELRERHERLRAATPRPTPPAPSLIATAAAEVAAHGQAGMGGRDLTLKRFWHGDAVLVIIAGTRRSAVRIDHKALRDTSSLEASLRRHLETTLPGDA